MHKSVQDFLRLAAEGSYFETTFGRFVFIKRVSGMGYEIAQQAIEGRWKPISAFRVTGELQPAKTKQINVSELGL